MIKPPWMIYGVTGYTGELTAREAVRLGMSPVLAGRNAEKVKALAEELSLSWKAFSLEDPQIASESIQGMHVVLHCAGPFIETAKPMAKACLTQKVHYTDITGEIPVYAALQALDEQAKKAGVMLLPGIGFDIIPTDCVGAMLKKQLPDATHLALAFVGLGGISPGTMKSALAQMPDGSKVRENGQIRTVPMFSRERKIKLYRDEITVYAIPWGDVFTAWYSTGIGNIEVFTMLPEALAFIGKIAAGPFISIVKSEFIQKAGRSLIDTVVKGPSTEKREKGYAIVWGEVRNAKGIRKELRLKTHEGYRFTVEASLAAIKRILENQAIAGFQTPSLVFGAEFVLSLEGSKVLKG